jgi:carbon-monoxide dehydrogenase medium subunit
VKPVPFRFQRPGDLAEALALLAQYGPEAWPIAGGQSLMPLLNMRVARPTVLVGLDRLPELAAVEVQDEKLVLGAMVRQAPIVVDKHVSSHIPLLAAATRLVGNAIVRNRGTIGGSLAHGDHSAEIPAAVMVLDSELVLQSHERTRVVRAREFYLGSHESVRQPDELLIEVRTPIRRRGGHGFCEVSKRAGDPAIAGAAAVMSVNEGVVDEVELVTFGLGVPAASCWAVGELVGQAPSSVLINSVADEAAETAPQFSDPRAPASYRRRALRACVARALTAAQTPPTPEEDPREEDR